MPKGYNKRIFSKGMMDNFQVIEWTRFSDRWVDGQTTKAKRRVTLLVFCMSSDDALFFYEVS